MSPVENSFVSTPHNGDGEAAGDSVRLSPGGALTNPHDIEAAVTAVEPLPRTDITTAFEHAVTLERQAARAGMERERLRAQLVIADVQIRRGQGRTGALTAEGIRHWAQVHDDDYVLARVNRVLAHLYWRVGDLAMALDSVASSVKMLGDRCDPVVKVEHRLALADTLMESGAFQAAHADYQAIIKDCEKLQLPMMRLAALNNLAFLWCRLGRLDDAVKVANRIMALGADYRGPLRVTWVETVARIRIGEGRPDQAVALLKPLIEVETVMGRDHLISFAECLLCHAEASRLVGDTAEARIMLDRCLDLVAAHHLEVLRGDILCEQAEFAAHTGDYKTAFEFQREAFRKATGMKAKEQDARARESLVVHQMSSTVADREKFRRLSLLDALTGLGNRRFVNETLDVCLEWARTEHRPVAVAVFDLDHFKRVNDRFGHDVGDTVLAEVAMVLAREVGMRPGAERHGTQRAAREVDIDTPLESPDAPYAARLGGEEFLLVLPGLEAAQARRQVEAVLDAVRGHDWAGVVPARSVTGSVGLVCGHGEAPSAHVLRAADELLYLAKEQGRDRVVGPAVVTRSDVGRVRGGV